MIKREIKKRNGKTRTIYAVNRQEADQYRSLLPDLGSKARNMAPDAHGFIAGRSPVTNAMVHIGWTYTLSMDIENFFDSIKPHMVAKHLSKQEIETCFIDGAPRQGIPTSPAIANIAGAAMDIAIRRSLRKVGLDDGEYAYSRYADDINVSYNIEGRHHEIRSAVRGAVHQCGFKVATHKTRLQCSRHGRRVICGVAIDADGSIHPTRAFRRRLRCALHSDPDAPETRGMIEWSQLRPPKNDHGERSTWFREACKLAEHGHARMPKSAAQVHKSIPEMDLGGNVFITNDPVYFVGMSSFTTGWTTCMAPNKRKWRGFKKWMQLRGTSIAVLLDEETKTIASVTRRVMRARCLVHRVSETTGGPDGQGMIVSDRIFGVGAAQYELEMRLAEYGIIRAIQASKSGATGKRIVGHVSARGTTPFTDQVSQWTETINGRIVWGVRLL